MNPRCNPIMVFDFETGGFDCRKQPAIEFAAIWLDPVDFKHIDSYEAVIKAYNDMEIDPKALEVNGITPEEIEDGEELAVVVKEIIARTEAVNKGQMRGKKCILAGQSVQFDIGFLQAIFKETKQDLSKIFEGAKDFYGNFQPAAIDTQYLGRTKHADSDKTAFGLSNLCSYENIDLVDAHRAMNDVISTVDLVINYMLSLREGNEGAKSYRYRDEFKFQI